MLKSVLIKITIFTAGVLLLFGCSSSYVMLPPEFDVQPIEEQEGYFTEEETECSSTYIEFVQQEGDLFLFYAEVKNNSEDTLALYPAEIYLEVIDEFENQNIPQSKRYFALNPKHEIEIIDRQLKEENDRHDGATVVNIAFGVLSTVADLVSDSEDKEDAVATDIFATGMNQVGEEVYHSDNEKSLEEVKKFWLEDMLNEAFIAPGDTISGLVYLPYNLNAKMFNVVIPVCGYPDSYTFKQQRKN